MANFYCTTTFGIDRPVEIELVFEKDILKTDAETLYETVDGETRALCRSAASGEKAYWGTSHEILIRDFYKAAEENKPFWIDGESAIPVLRLLKRSTLPLRRTARRSGSKTSDKKQNREV